MRLVLAAALAGMLFACAQEELSAGDDEGEFTEDAGEGGHDALDAGASDGGPQSALSSARWVRRFGGPARDGVSALAVLSDGGIAVGASRSSLETGCDELQADVADGGGEAVGVAQLREDGSCARWSSAVGTAWVVALAPSQSDDSTWVAATEGWVSLSGASYARRTSGVSVGAADALRAFAWQPTGRVVDLKSAPGGGLVVLEVLGTSGELTATFVERTGAIRWRRAFGAQSFLAAFTASGDVVLAGDTYGDFEIDGLHVEGGLGTPVLMRLAGEDGRALWVQSLPEAQGSFTSVAVHAETVVAGGLLYSYQPSTIQWGADRLESSGGPFILTASLSGTPGWVSPVGPVGTFPLVAVGPAGIAAALTSDDQCRDQRLVAVDWKGEVRSSTPFLLRACSPEDPQALFRISAVSAVGEDAVVAGTFTGIVPGDRGSGDLSADGSDGFVARIHLDWGAVPPVRPR